MFCLQRILTNCESPALLKLVNSCANKIDSEGQEPLKKRKLSSLLKDFKSQGQFALKAPYFKRLVILCICFFCSASSFYSLFIWFPEIFQRFAYFEAHYPNQIASICSVSSKRLSSENTTMVRIFQYFHSIL